MNIEAYTMPKIAGQEINTSKLKFWSEIIAAWTHKEHMLPKSSQQLYEKLASGEAVLVSNGDQPAAYCEFDVWEPNHVEIGGLVTNPECRKQGWGSKAAKGAIALAKENHPNATIFALATNTASVKLFEKIGATPLSPETLPLEVWTWCIKCPAFSDTSCCATPLDLSHIEADH